MVVKYGYSYMVSKYRSKWVGYYQCDVDEFKKMWHKVRKEFDVRVLYVYIGDKVYSWTKLKGWKV